MTRVDAAWFKTLLEARTNPDGTPKKGFRANVEMLKREIARIERGAVDTPAQPAA
jgi:hypothetical protein